MAQGFTSPLQNPLPVIQGGTGVTTSTGTGNVVLSTSPNLVTPVLGTPTSGTVTNLTGDPTGSSTNDSAAAGHVGEYISSSVLVAGAIGVSSGAATTITSISLTAGDWDVAASLQTNATGGTIISDAIGSISQTNNTLSTPGADNGYTKFGVTILANQNHGLPITTTRISLSTTTTVYLVGQITFTVSTCSCYGFIGARRAR